MAPTGPILQFETVLLELPVVIELALKKMVPPLVAIAAIDAPLIVQFVIILFVASRNNLIVLVPLVEEAVVFSIVRELPPVFNPWVRGIAFFFPNKSRIK